MGVILTGCNTSDSRGTLLWPLLTLTTDWLGSERGVFLFEGQKGVPGEGGPVNEVLNVKWYLPGRKEGKSRADVRKHRWYGVFGGHPILLDGGSAGNKARGPYNVYDKYFL